MVTNHEILEARRHLEQLQAEFDRANSPLEPVQVRLAFEHMDGRLSALEQRTRRIENVLLEINNGVATKHGIREEIPF